MKTVLLPSNIRDLASMMWMVKSSPDLEWGHIVVMAPKRPGTRGGNLREVSVPEGVENLEKVFLYQGQWGNHLDGISERHFSRRAKLLARQHRTIERVVFSDNHHIRATIVQTLFDEQESRRSNIQKILIPEGLGSFRDTIESYVFLDWRNALRRYWGDWVDQLKGYRPHNSWSLLLRGFPFLIPRSFWLLLWRPQLPAPMRIADCDIVISLLPDQGRGLPIKAKLYRGIATTKTAQIGSREGGALFIHQPFSLGVFQWAEMLTELRRRGVTEISLKSHRSEDGWPELISAAFQVFGRENTDLVTTGLAEELMLSNNYAVVSGITSTALVHALTILKGAKEVEIVSFLDTVKKHSPAGSSNWDNIVRQEKIIRSYNDLEHSRIQFV